MSADNWTVADFKEWLARPGNGDARCTCGHQLNHHYADLNGCGWFGKDCCPCPGFMVGTTQQGRVVDE